MTTETQPFWWWSFKIWSERILNVKTYFLHLIFSLPNFHLLLLAIENAIFCQNWKMLSLFPLEFSVCFTFMFVWVAWQRIGQIVCRLTFKFSAIKYRPLSVILSYWILWYYCTMWGRPELVNTKLVLFNFESI